MSMSHLLNQFVTVLKPLNMPKGSWGQDALIFFLTLILYISQLRNMAHLFV